ncbi:VWA domain-containing protein [Streptomyces sp. NPDC004290]
MGIRSMLRKVFGRDREESPATSVPPQTRENQETTTAPEPVEASDRVASAESGTPEPVAPESAESSATQAAPAAPDTEAHRAADDLVAAAFDNPQIPKARTAEPTVPTEPAVPAEEPKAAEVAKAAPTAAESAVVAEAPTAPEPEAAAPAEVAEEKAVLEPRATAPAEEPAVAEAAPVAPVAEAAPVAAEPSVVAEESTTPEPEAAAPAEAVVVADAVEEPVEAAEPASVATPEEPVTPEEPETVAAADSTPAPEAEAAAEPQAEVTVPAEPEAVAADETSPAEPEAALAEPEALVVADDITPAEPQTDEPQTAPAAVAPAAPTDQAPTDEAPAPVTAAPAGEAPATAVEAPAPAPGKPALPLAAVRAVAPHLVDAYKAAGAQLKKQQLTGARATVYLVVDRSGSMRGYFKDGSVQRLAEQVTALAAHLDETATVTTVFFSTDIDGTVDLTPAGLTPTRVEAINGTLGRLGRTNYHRAVEEVLAHHEKNDPARPALVVFQTDGAPESRAAAVQALAEAADRPLQWRFVAWGEGNGKAFDFLRKLDGTPRTATYFAGVTPVETPHAAFYRGLLSGLEL